MTSEVFCFFPGGPDEGGDWSSVRRLGLLEDCWPGAFRFLEGCGAECRRGAGSGGVVEAADSAASLAEERVTLRDMSERSIKR